jgi:hypothetical protein
MDLTRSQLKTVFGTQLSRLSSASLLNHTMTESICLGKDNAALDRFILTTKNSARGVAQHRLFIRTICRRQIVLNNSSEGDDLPPILSHMEMRSDQNRIWTSGSDGAAARHGLCHLIERISSPNLRYDIGSRAGTQGR